MRAAADLRAALLAVALTLPACGGASDGANGEMRAPRAPDATQGHAPKDRRAARILRHIEPVELLPADLDLVARIDLARMRAGLGGAALDQLAQRALEEAPDEALRDALKRAEVVWLGLRLADLEAGDRVVVIEGKMAELPLDTARWQRVPSGVSGVLVFDRRSAAPRGGTARLIALGDHAVALVTPVEVSSVARVLRDGPDERRGDPAAEGLVSLDLRPHRLPPALERRFPSIGALVAGIERVRAVATLSEQGVRLDAQIVGAQPAGADRARRFLEAMRDNVEAGRSADLMKGLSIEQVERTVELRWLFPSRFVLSLLSRAAPE